MKTPLKILSIALLSAFSLNACKDKPRDKTTVPLTAEGVNNSADDNVHFHQ